MIASWISPHKFHNKAKHLKKEEKRQRKAAERHTTQHGEEGEAVVVEEEMTVEEEGKSQFSHLDKWFDARPMDAQLKSRIVFAKEGEDKSSESAPNRTPAILLKILEEMLSAGIQVYQDKVGVSGDDTRGGNSKSRSSFSFEEEIIRKGTSTDKIAALALMVAKNPTHNVSKLDQLLKLCSSSNGRVSDLAVKTVKDLMLNNLLPTAEEGTNNGALFSLRLFKDRDVAMLYDAIVREQELKSNNSNNNGMDTGEDGETEASGKQVKPFQMRKRITFNKDGTKQEVVEEVTKVKHIDVESLTSLHKRFLFFWYFEDLLRKRMTQFISILVDRTKSTTPSLQIFAVIDLRHMIRGTTNECPDRVIILRAMIDKLKDSNKQVASNTMKFMTSLLNPLLSAEDASYNRFFVKDLDRRFVVKEVAQVLYNPSLPSESKLYAATLLNRIELMEKVDRDLAKDLIVCYLKTCDIHFRKNESSTSTMRAVLTGIHRALGVSDTHPEELTKALDTIFIIARSSHFNNAVEALRIIWMLSENASDPRTIARFYSILYEKLFDEGIRRHANKTSTFLSLLFKAMNKDTNTVRQRAFCKRILQSAFIGTTEYACSCIMLLKNFLNYHQDLKNMYENSEAALRKGEGVKDANDNDNDSEDSDNEDSMIRIKTKGKEKSQSSATKPDSDSTQLYDPSIPTPLRTNAEITALYEMLPFAHYYHPSGNHFAKSTLDNKKIKNYEGNPMEDFTTVRFLDKFMYRKAKKNPKLSLNPLQSIQTTADDSSLEKQIEALNANNNEGDTQKLPPRYMVQPDEMYKFRFLKKQREADKLREMSTRTKQKERMELNAQYRQSIIEESDKKLEEDLDVAYGSDEDDDNASVFSYSELDRVLQEDAFDDEDMEEIMLENLDDEDDLDDMSDDADSGDDDDNQGRAKNKNKNKKLKGNDGFGYDVTTSTKDDLDQDEMASLFEEAEEELVKAAKNDDKRDRQYDYDDTAQNGKRQTKEKNKKRNRDGVPVVKKNKTKKLSVGDKKLGQKKMKKRNTRK